MIELGDRLAPAFSQWLGGTRVALVEGDGVDVPCAECDACCRSSYFIHIRPDEAHTLALIPQQLLFAAPGMPSGNVLMGYDENGCCPMLGRDGCTIYSHRPVTCRSYDCRVFAAAGIAADRTEISRRGSQWTFSYPCEDDRREHSAVQTAARFLTEHAECFPGGDVPSSPAELAILAVKVYDVFLQIDDDPSAMEPAPSDRELAKAVMAGNETFEARRQTIAATPNL